MPASLNRAANLPAPQAADEGQRCADEMQRRGFYIVKGAHQVSESTKAEIRASKAWENIFNGRSRNGKLTHDGFRRQTQGDEGWESQVKPHLKETLRELGVLECSDGQEKTLNILVALKSLQRAKKKRHQPRHADSANRNSLRESNPKDVPSAALLAIQPRTRLHVWPFDTDREEVVEMDEGDLIIFRGDLGHAGAEYDEEDLIDGAHLRLHVYIDSPLVVRQTDEHDETLTFPF